MINIVIGLSLGLADYLSRLTPVSYLHPIPLLSLICIALSFKGLLKKSWDEYLPEKPLLLLLFWGLALGISRYFLFYKEDGFVYMPIVRHFAAFTIGIFTYQVLKTKLRNTNFYKLSLAITLSSTIFLLIGIYQHFNHHYVGTFLRTQSLFTEPSYFGDYLVQIVAPCIFSCFWHFEKISRSLKVALCLVMILWVLNFLFAQSATAVLKMGSLVFCFFLFYPAKAKHKIIPALAIFLSLLLVLIFNQGYVKSVTLMALNILKSPDLFFKYHTFYDRFYPIYASVKELPSISGILGHGFGGDYFEFQNLFPPSTHEKMLWHKPNFSFFNSFASKVIYYFGLAGLIWILTLFKRGFKTKNFIIRAGLVNILVCSLWGVSNFALPYIWLWLALSDKERKEET